ncbi:hypothetical protein [Amycolatopsis methanolica]
MAKVQAAVQSSVTAGHLLPEDAATIVEAARNSGIGG